MVVYSKLKPRFQGGKLKVQTAYKKRFKRLKDGTIEMFPPGFRHKRSKKGKSQKQRLKAPRAMHKTYANTLKKMGFK